MGFFDSEVVQEEAKKLFEDYQSLIQLGGEYGKFDREGKKIFIDQMEALMDRYKIFMKRFELSEDFMAQMTVEQLKTQLEDLTETSNNLNEKLGESDLIYLSISHKKWNRHDNFVQPRIMIRMFF